MPIVATQLPAKQNIQSRTSYNDCFSYHQCCSAEACPRRMRIQRQTQY